MFPFSKMPALQVQAYLFRILDTLPIAGTVGNVVFHTWRNHALLFDDVG